MQRLAIADYEWLDANDGADRLSAEDLRFAIKEYGRQVITPPESSWHQVDVVPIRGAERPSWSVRLPLYTVEEGRSDLELELTVWQTANGTFGYELDNLHVP